MILSDRAILAAMDRGEIVIEPFDPECLGGNSYDVHLGSVVKTYDGPRLATRESAFKLGGVGAVRALDVAEDNPTVRHVIGPEGMLLVPGTLYLASTVEYTETHRHVPYLDGKSSTGRLGIGIHLTAGRGDVGFCNHWTMEVFVVQPVVVRAGMPIGQLTYHAVEGEVERVYSRKRGSAYAGLGRDPEPQPSRMWVKIGGR